MRTEEARKRANPAGSLALHDILQSTRPDRLDAAAPAADRALVCNIAPNVANEALGGRPSQVPWSVASLVASVGIYLDSPMLVIGAMVVGMDVSSGIARDVSEAIPHPRHSTDSSSAG